MKLNEDFTKLYNRWKGGNKRNEDNAINKFISKQEHPEKITIENGLLDCDCDIEITQEDLVNDKLPFKFGYVTGRFTLSNCKITSLEGMPDLIGEDLDLRNIRGLKTLEHCTQSIGINFYLTAVFEIENLIGCPQRLGGSIHIFQCDKLNSLNGLPKKIFSDLSIKYCKQLNSLKHLPREINGDLRVYECGKKFDKETDLPKSIKIDGDIELSAW